jgi:hypothetical protein
LAALTSGPTPVPSLVVNSGYGLHAVSLFRDPSRDKARWRAIQQAIVRSFADYGADPACAPDEARVLRLVPYPNRKLSPDSVGAAAYDAHEALCSAADDRARLSSMLGRLNR